LPRDHPVVFDGLADPLCHSLPRLYAEFARAFGPVMARDIAVAPSAGEARLKELYLRAVLNSLWNARVNGFLWAAFRDIPSLAPAALRSGIDGTLGLVDESGAVKPGHEYFLEFARGLPDVARPRIAANHVGLYLPKHYYARGNPENASNHPRDLSRSLATAHYHLRNAGFEVRCVRGDRPLDPRTKTLFIAGANLRPDEAAALAIWVEAGGRLIWHGADPLNWGLAYQHLLGATPVDYVAPRDSMVEWAGAQWKIGVYPRNMRVVVESFGAKVVVSDDAGLPVVLHHELGKGSVTYALPRIDEAVARGPSERSDRDRCTKWYEAMLRE
jgi:hypothetical protein